MEGMSIRRLGRGKVWRPILCLTSNHVSSANITALWEPWSKTYNEKWMLILDFWRQYWLESVTIRLLSIDVNINSENLDDNSLFVFNAYAQKVVNLENVYQFMENLFHLLFTLKPGFDGTIALSIKDIPYDLKQWRYYRNVQKQLRYITSLLRYFSFSIM